MQVKKHAEREMEQEGREELTRLGELGGRWQGREGKEAGLEK